MKRKRWILAVVAVLICVGTVWVVTANGIQAQLSYVSGIRTGWMAML